MQLVHHISEIHEQVYSYINKVYSAYLTAYFSLNLSHYSQKHLPASLSACKLQPR